MIFYNIIAHENPTIMITTDASNTCWGATTTSQTATSGNWGDEDKGKHIHFLELKAVYFGLKSLVDDVIIKILGTVIKLLSDNTTAVACINKMGATQSSSCKSLTGTLWQWDCSHNNWLIASHIQGILNVEADKLTRRNTLQTE